MQQLSCPSCSAPLEVKHRFSRVVTCGYCGQCSYLTKDGLDPSGKKAELVDFESILSLGKTGTLQGVSFEVLGRMRCDYGSGFWDEWFCIDANGQAFWLQEDDGVFTRFQKAEIRSAIPPFAEVGVGTLIPINDQQFFVTEKSKAVIKGGEGELPFRVLPETPLSYVDGNVSGKRASIEFFTDEICFSLGEDIERKDIQV